jgi:RimJ/RimL family protein N-acetyltransferase
MKKISIIGESGFILRPLKKADYKVLTRKINDRSIYRFTTNIPYPYSVSDARKWLEKVMRRYRSKLPDAYDLAIEINGELAGSISLMKIEKGHKAELGYWLAKEYRGQGIMSRAIAEMVRIGFNKLKLKKIYAYVFTHNTASYRVLVKNGFKKEGLLIQHVKKDGKLKDEYILAKYT